MLGLLGWLEGTAEASEVGGKPFGLGVVVGDPTGLSAKLYLGGTTNAVDFALAFDTAGIYDDYVYFHATYLWHPSVLASGSGAEVPWHVGVGGFAASDRWDNRGEDDVLGVRVPIGIDVNLESVPLQFFGDLGLRLALLPGTDVDFDVGVGARFYF
jgi:hypothetical protein